MNDFFYMGGYGLFVWLSYGLTAVVMVLNVVIPLLQERTLRRELLMRFQRDQVETN